MGYKKSWQRKSQVDREVFESEHERLFGKKPERVPYTYKKPEKIEEKSRDK